MDILISMAVGGIIGWIAGMLMKTDAQMGVLANIVVGIVGSSFGTWLFGVLGFTANGRVAQLIVAIGGAMALIAILKAAKVLK